MNASSTKAAVTASPRAFTNSVGSRRSTKTQAKTGPMSRACTACTDGAAGSSLRGDMGALLVDVLRSQDNPLARQVIPVLLQELGRDPALGQQLEEAFLVREEACIDAVLARAVARGELPAAPPVHAVHALLMGPVFAWVFVLRRDTAEFVNTLGDAVTAAVVHLALSSSAPSQRVES